MTLHTVLTRIQTHYHKFHAYDSCFVRNQQLETENNYILSSAFDRRVLFCVTFPQRGCHLVATMLAPTCFTHVVCTQSCYLIAVLLRPKMPWLSHTPESNTKSSALYTSRLTNCPLLRGLQSLDVKHTESFASAPLLYDRSCKSCMQLNHFQGL